MGKELAVKSGNSTRDTSEGGVWPKPSVCVRAVDLRCTRYRCLALEAVWGKKVRGLVGTERGGRTDKILFLLAETTVVPTVE